jgi:hypothetical protein
MNINFVVRLMRPPEPNRILFTIHFTLGVDEDEFVTMHHPRYFMNYPWICYMFVIHLTTRTFP